MAMDREAAQSQIDLANSGTVKIPEQTLANLQAFVNSDNDAKTFTDYVSKYGDAGKEAKAVKADEDAQVAAGVNPWDKYGQFDAQGKKISGPVTPAAAPYAQPGDPGYQAPAPLPANVAPPGLSRIPTEPIVSRPDLSQVARALGSDAAAPGASARQSMGTPSSNGVAAPSGNPHDLSNIFKKDDMGFYDTGVPGKTSKQYLQATIENAKLANDNIKDSGIDEKLGQQSLYENEINRATKTAEMQESEAAHLEQMEKERQANEVIRQQKVAATFDKYQNAINDYSKMKVDPEHFMNSRTGGQKAMLVLGALAGGALQGLRGGANPAMQIINASIDRDIDAQKEAISQAGNKANMIHNTYSDMLALTKDAQSAEILTRKLYTDNMAQQIQAASAKYDAPKLQAQSQLVLAQLGKDSAKQDAEFRFRLDQMSQGFNRTTGTAVFNNGADVVQPNNVVTIDGYPFEAPNQKTAETAAGKLDAARSLNNALDELQSVADKGTGYMNSQEGRRRYDIAVNRVAMEANKATNGSSRPPSQPEIDQVKDSLTNKVGLLRTDLGDPQAGIDSWRKVASQQEAQAREGLVPLTKHLVQAKKGSSQGEVGYTHGAAPRAKAPPGVKATPNE